jgi:hypothetical protein
LRNRASMASRLPPELTDTVIDYLHDDKHSLAACSLVCQAWVPASRYHLFGSVTIPPRKVQSFIDIIYSRTCTIRPHVSRFVVDQLPPLQQFQTIVVAIHTLPFVRSLYLRNTVLVPSPAELRVIAGSMFGRIINLILENVGFGTFDDFVLFMSSFPRLETFVVRQLSWSLETSLSRVWWTTPSTLRVLDLQICPVAGILRWICSPSPIPPVHTVHFRGLTTPWLFGVQYFLRALGSSLHHISLRYYFSPKEIIKGPDLCRLLDLSHNCALRTIDLDMTLHQLFLPLSPLVDGTPLLLSQITSHAMEEVTLRLSLYSIYDINALDWESLARVFALPQFSSLRRIHCQIGYSTDEVVTQSWQTLIQAKLHACHGRGLLRISVVPFPDQ